MALAAAPPRWPCSRNSGQNAPNCSTPVALSGQRFRRGGPFRAEAQQRQGRDRVPERREPEGQKEPARTHLEPAHDHLLEGGLVRVAARVPSDVRRPHRHSRHGRALTNRHCRLELMPANANVSQGLSRQRKGLRDGGLSGPVRANVAGPQRRAHRPGAGPGVPAQDKVVAGLVADRLEAITETLAPICTRVHVRSRLRARLHW